jgi:hypothetical protein
MSGRRQLLARWFSCKRVAPPTVPWCCCWCCRNCYCCYHYHYCYRRYYYYCCYFQKSFQKSFQRSSHCFQMRNRYYCYHRYHLPRSYTVFDLCYCILLWCSARNTWLLRREFVAAADDVVRVPSWSSLSFPCCVSYGVVWT